MAGNHDGLTGLVEEPVTVEVDSQHARARRGWEHFAEAERHRHGEICYRNEMSLLRRSRGALLRLVRQRRLAILLGLAMIGPSAYIQFSGRFDLWWLQGVSLVVGATGLALFWTGLTGVSPDWVDDEKV
jgi:hypothetical protein